MSEVSFQGCQLGFIDGPENHQKSCTFYTKRPEIWPEKEVPVPDFSAFA